MAAAPRVPAQNCTRRLRDMIPRRWRKRVRSRSSGPTSQTNSSSTCGCAICQSRWPAASCRGASPSCRPSSTRASCACRSTTTWPTSGSRPTAPPAMAVPFYLAHPRLERLERAQMLEVEGGDHEWCMRILRHEAGHVIDNAYRLRLRRQRPRAVRHAVGAVPRVLHAEAVQQELRACTSTRGTRRATPTRTSPRPSRCG